MSEFYEHVLSSLKENITACYNHGGLRTHAKSFAMFVKDEIGVRVYFEKKHVCAHVDDDVLKWSLQKNSSYVCMSKHRHAKEDVQALVELFVAIEFKKPVKIGAKKYTLQYLLDNLVEMTDDHDNFTQKMLLLKHFVPSRRLSKKTRVCCSTWTLSYTGEDVCTLRRKSGNDSYIYADLLVCCKAAHLSGCSIKYKNETRSLDCAHEQLASMFPELWKEFKKQFKKQVQQNLQSLATTTPCASTPTSPQSSGGGPFSGGGSSSGLYPPLNMHNSNQNLHNSNQSLQQNKDARPFEQNVKHYHTHNDYHNDLQHYHHNPQIHSHNSFIETAHHALLQMHHKMLAELLLHPNKQLTELKDEVSSLKNQLKKTGNSFVDVAESVLAFKIAEMLRQSKPHIPKLYSEINPIFVQYAGDTEDDSAGAPAPAFFTSKNSIDASGHNL